MGSITIEQIASYASITIIILTCIEAIKKTFFKSTEDKIKALQSTSQITLESLLALINHEIDGNGKEAMKTVRDKLQKQLIEK